MRAERPGFTPGYGIAATDDGLLPWSWAEERLTTARTYWVSTTRADGRPHAAPVWGIWLDGALVFSTDPGSVKGRALAHRPAAVVHLDSGDEAVVCEGTVERMNVKSEIESAGEVYRSKYGTGIDPDNPGHGVYRLRPDIVLAWREADFPTSATRFRS